MPRSRRETHLSSLPAVSIVMPSTLGFAIIPTRLIEHASRESPEPMRDPSQPQPHVHFDLLHTFHSVEFDQIFEYYHGTWLCLIALRWCLTCSLSSGPGSETRTGSSRLSPCVSRNICGAWQSQTVSLLLGSRLLTFQTWFLAPPLHSFSHSYLS
jgi:hypothetical protein